MTLDVANAATRCQDFETYRRAQQKKLTDIELKLAEKSSPSTSAPTTVVRSGGVEMVKSKPLLFQAKQSIILNLRNPKRGSQVLCGKTIIK